MQLRACGKAIRAEPRTARGSRRGADEFVTRILGVGTVVESAIAICELLGVARRILLEGFLVQKARRERATTGERVGR